MSKISRKFDLVIVDTHMGLFDFTIRCVVGDYRNGVKYAAYVFEMPEYEELADETNFGYEARGKTYFRTGYVPIIWIPRKPETPREYATLAHESIHAVNHLFEWSATPLGGDTEEVFAHAVAHVVDNILKRLGRIK